MRNSEIGSFGICRPFEGLCCLSLWIGKLRGLFERLCVWLPVATGGSEVWRLESPVLKSLTFSFGSWSVLPLSFCRTALACPGSCLAIRSCQVSGIGHQGSVNKLIPDTCRLIPGTGFWPCKGRVVEIKRQKGIWWMPWHREAMKDVARCDKPRGAVSKL